MDFLPDVKEQRQMLQEKLVGFKREGYALLIQWEAAKAQNLGKPTDTITVPDGQRMKQMTVKEYLDGVKHVSDNAFAGARRIQELLDALPREEEAPLKLEG